MKEAERIFKEAAICAKAVQIKGETYAFDNKRHVMYMFDLLIDELGFNDLYIDDDSTFLCDEKRIAKDIKG